MSARSPKRPSDEWDQFSERPVGLREIVDVLASEANRTMSSQRALIAANYRDKPDPTELRRAQVLDAARSLLEVIVPHWPAVRDTLERVKRRGGHW